MSNYQQVLNTKLRLIKAKSPKILTQFTKKEPRSNTSTAVINLRPLPRLNTFNDINTTLNTHDTKVINKWRLPSLIELTLIIFNVELAHLGSEA